MDLNLRPISSSQAIATDMLERRRGSIINVGSINGAWRPSAGVRVSKPA